MKQESKNLMPLGVGVVRKSYIHLTRIVRFSILIISFIAVNTASAQWLLIPMEQGKQTNHLKAYGLTYWALETPREYRCYWWLNYRGGAFVLPDSQDVRIRAVLMGVRFEPMKRCRLYRHQAICS